MGLPALVGADIKEEYDGLMGMGVDELSVPSNRILRLRCVIRNSGFE